MSSGLVADPPSSNPARPFFVLEGSWSERDQPLGLISEVGANNAFTLLCCTSEASDIGVGDGSPMLRDRPASERSRD